MHESKEVDSLAVHKEALRIKCIWTQFTQSDDRAENILQINFRK